MASWPILSVTIFLPLLGVLWIMSMRREDEAVARNARWAALWTTLATFADLSVESFTVDLSSGAMENPALTATGTTPLVIAGACGSTPVSGLLRADVAISGNRTSDSEGLLVGAIEPNDLRLDLTLAAKPCR